MIIRKHEPREFERLYEIDHTSFPADIAYSHLELQYYTRSRKCRTLVADVDGEVLGFVIGQSEPRRLGHIITIEVMPHMQRQQIGTRLLEEIEDWLWGRGASVIYLETAIDDAGARGFYERHNYFVVERLAGYYAASLDAFLMMKTAKR